MLATILATGLLAAAAPRPSPQADPRSPRGMTMDDYVPSPDSAARTEAPRPMPVSRFSQPLPTTGTRPASTTEPRTSIALRGTATWFRSPSGVSAAGPALRAALGPGWRGTRVKVCHGGRCLWTVLGDWCLCRDDRVIDLHAPLFARLAPLSRGVLEVTVKW